MAGRIAGLVGQIAGLAGRIAELAGQLAGQLVEQLPVGGFVVVGFAVVGFAVVAVASNVVAVVEASVDPGLPFVAGLGLEQRFAVVGAVAVVAFVGSRSLMERQLG